MTSLAEMLAVVLALVYVVLAIREKRLCWVAAVISAALYIWVFAGAALYMESLLQVFYAVMAVYGWLSWGQDNSGGTLQVVTWSLRRHLILAFGVAVLAGVLGLVLDQFTAAALPYLDSMTTLSAVVATWMVARKVLENWLWWIAIDAASIWLYLERDLQLTALLFGGYVLLAIAGYATWRRHWVTETGSALQTS